MAHLLIRRGAQPGHRIPLAKDQIILGRSPDCDLPIPSPSISRQHARILRMQERWFLEDMLSRNGTHLNEQLLTTRTQLHTNDRIRICDFEAIFLETATLGAAAEGAPLDVRALDGEDVESSSTLSVLASQGSKVLEIQSADNLRIIMEINNRLCRTLEMDQLLPRITDSLLEVFRQADRCFVILEEEATGNLVQEATRTRRSEDAARAQFSRGVVHQCLETRHGFLSEDLAKDKRPMPRGREDRITRSVLCAPLNTNDDRTLGAIQLDTLDNTRNFTASDLKLLVGLAHQITIAVQNARLYQEMQQREQVERDLELAAQVQKSILPERLPELPGYQFFAHYASALEVGGDYFDFIPLPPNRLAVTVGDVAGKSVPAAILMAKLSSDVRTCLLIDKDPAVALARLNSLLYRHIRQTDRWITFAAALLDTATQMVTLVSAGHCAPLFCSRESGTVRDAMPKDVAGVPLGVMEAPVYGSYQVKLEAGDSLLLFTDGVPDALNAQNQPFKLQGIEATLREGGPLSPRALGERLVKAVEQHAAGRSQYDDITLVAFGHLG
jgi:serine phosphatase RsbU (regulator of sigma subunit)/pSer/pThr/pTyr-binding forkhead associated (FHA) protein